MPGRRRGQVVIEHGLVLCRPCAVRRVGTWECDGGSRAGSTPAAAGPGGGTNREKPSGERPIRLKKLIRAAGNVFSLVIVIPASILIGRSKLLGEEEKNSGVGSFVLR
ncbi:hypothetical protein EJB05_21475, partial [Eragrostis curvula]